MGLVRVSVANLVLNINTIGTGESCRVGILNANAFEKGMKRYQALGGGAQLTLLGVNFLREKFAAREFELDGDTGFHDARFLIEERHLREVLNWFESFSGIGHRFEHDPDDEIRHELCNRELTGIPPIVSVREMLEVKVVYKKNVRQPEPKTGQGTSLRERPGIPTRRLFRLYDLWASPLIVRKIINSKAIRVLTKPELATTEGGSSRGHTKDGIEIADNLFL